MRLLTKYKPKKISAVLENYLDFDDARICRGYVLRIWKDKVCTAAGSEHWLHDFDRAWMTGAQADRDSAAFCNPELVIKLQAGSLWIPELHARRYQVLQRINKRIGRDFLRSVRIK